METETVQEFLGITSEDVIFNMLEYMRDGEEAKALCIVEECETRGKNMVLVVKAILEALTYATAYKASGTLPVLSDVYCSRLKEFAESIPEPRIGQFCGTFLQVYALLTKNAQLSFFLKAAIVNLISSESLLSRLEREVSYLREGLHCARPVEEPAQALEQMPGNKVSPETDERNEGIDDVNVVPSEDGGNADGTGEENVSAKRIFEGVPEFEDYDRDIQDIGNHPECGSLDDAGEETSAKDNVSGIQEGQIVDVDELFRMMEGACSDTDGSNTDNIVPFSTKGKEEPADQRYVGKSEDDIFAAFDFYMAGGSARRGS